MKQLMNRFAPKTILTLSVLFFSQMIALAQDTKVEINGNDVGSWFSRNWIWVTAVIAVLLILLILSGGSSRRSKTKTTVYRRDDGTVTKTTSSESDID